MNYQLFERTQADIRPDLRLLDTLEQARYQRFCSPQRQLEFLTGRTLLKTLLADLLHAEPAAIGLALTPNGQPYLPAVSRAPQLRFSLAHASERYLVGVSAHHIGVDVERIQPVDLARVQHFLSALERQQLAALPAPERSRQFYRLFTRKEAFFKATDKCLPFEHSHCCLLGGEWQLCQQPAAYHFYQIEQAGFCTAVCLPVFPFLPSA